MERIPCKHSVVIDYTYFSIGQAISGSQLFSEIEGNLIISIEDKIIFSETDILLLELGKELKDWINKGVGDFYYDSMDYEDTPILFFKQVFLDNWQIGSVWIDQVYSDIKFLDLISGCLNFIDRLTHDLNANQINVKELL